jgi:hypothetical protein
MLIAVQLPEQHEAVSFRSACVQVAHYMSATAYASGALHVEGRKESLGAHQKIQFIHKYVKVDHGVFTVSPTESPPHPHLLYPEASQISDDPYMLEGSVPRDA